MGKEFIRTHRNLPDLLPAGGTVYYNDFSNVVGMAPGGSSGYSVSLYPTACFFQPSALDMTCKTSSPVSSDYV